MPVTTAADRIRRAARRQHHLYTAPAIDLAAALLEDLYRAGERHGVDRSRWGAVTDLPSAAIDIIDPWVDPWRDQVPQDHHDIARQLDLLVDALRSGPQPVLAERVDRLRVWVPRTQVTPPWGRDGRADLAVIIGRSGWDFLPFIGGMAPVIGVTGPYGEPGAAAVAELVREVLAGHHGNPFRNR